MLVQEHLFFYFVNVDEEKPVAFAYRVKNVEARGQVLCAVNIQRVELIATHVRS